MQETAIDSFGGSIKNKEDEEDVHWLLVASKKIVLVHTAKTRE